MARSIKVATVAFLSAILIAGLVHAGTLTFTTTADFDGGTKSQPGDGNFGTETNTDNLGIATGALELSSLKGDSFTLADSDANTFKWTPRSSGTGVCASHAISAGVDTMTIISDLPSACTANGDATISGDFDVRVKLTAVVAGTNNQRNLCLYDVSEFCDNTVGAHAGTVDGVHYRLLIGTLAAAFTVTAGVQTQIGTNSDPGCGNAATWLRITRSGTTITWLNSCNGSSWTTDETTTFSTPSSLIPSYEYLNNGATDGQVDADDFFVAAGTVDSPGFRTTGTWTTTTQTYTGEIVATITLTYSGATSTNVIDAVDVLDSSSNVLFSDPDDVTSGTERTYTVPYSANLKVDWTVRITLGSGGAGTATIESVQIETVPPPIGEGGGSNRRVSVSCYLDWLTQSAICADGSNYTGANVIGVNWYVDGSFVTQTGKNARVALPTGDSFFTARREVSHEIIMEVLIANGGRQPNTISVMADYTPRLLLFLSILAIVIGALIARSRRRTTKSVSYPRISNPNYRRTAISREEYPRGWVSYRQKEPGQYTAFRSKVLRRDSHGRPTVIAVFGLRPAKPAERARTGRARVAELQTVRERVR